MLKVTNGMSLRNRSIQFLYEATQQCRHACLLTPCGGKNVDRFISTSTFISPHYFIPGTQLKNTSIGQYKKNTISKYIYI